MLVDDVGAVGCEGAVEDAVLNYEEATVYFIMVFAVCKTCRECKWVGFVGDVDDCCTLVAAVYYQHLSIFRDFDAFLFAIHCLTELVDCDYFRVEEFVVATDTTEVFAPIVLAC